MSDDSLEELEERHDDIPGDEAMLESLQDPESHQRLAGIRSVMELSKGAFRLALVVGAVLTCYLCLIKLPVVVLGIGLGVIGSASDPLLAVLLGAFGVMWTTMGILQLWGAWSFYRLRKLQQVSTRRPIIHGIRGIVVMVTGVGIVGLAGAYAWLFMVAS